MAGKKLHSGDEIADNAEYSGRSRGGPIV